MPLPAPVMIAILPLMRSSSMKARPLADRHAAVEAPVCRAQTRPMLRRSFVVGLGGLWLPSAVRAETPLAADPFALGVASGRPMPDSVVLWTRLMPAGDLRGRPGPAMTGRLAVADDRV